MTTIFNNIIIEINDKLKSFKLLPHIKNVLSNLFINLNSNDLQILLTFSGFLIYRINNLFINDDENYTQFKNNNNQDIKAIILLLLPYINDEKINVYSIIKDLNELILNQELKKSDFKIDRSEILKSHFKYSTFGLGLFNKDDKLLLNDNEYDKLIYKTIYHNFISINETISTVNGKLYINWINIVPLTENNYTKSKIYIDTLEYLKKNTLADDIYTNLIDYNGLYVGEFYNIYRNAYYENIKKVKWFIFINQNKNYYIQYLNKIFNFDNFFNLNSYDDLNNYDKLIFNNKLKNINKNEYYIWKNIIIYFVNNYTYKHFIDKNISTSFNMNIDESIDGDDNKYEYNYFIRLKFNKITEEHIENFLSNIDPMHFWDYVKESLNIFKSTIYANFLIKDNKITDMFNLDKDSQINLKNIYNIAKSLSHYSQSKWVLLPIKYSSLTVENQLNFWNKFNNNIGNSAWINISKNLELEFSTDKTFENILVAFNEIKYELCWKYLITNGLLSEFKINLTNKIDTKSDSFKEYGNANYYLTNDKYKNHSIKTKDKKITLIEDLNNTNTKWYTFYAMNWINQINFFQHYLNHRVLYITGATGQGKSTQVPKLFLYSLKMLDYNNNGQVVCTQPRIGPTITNAKRIAKELGLPIEEYSDSLKDDIKSKNYYVQYSYSGDKHTINNTNHLSLKITTDGTLFNEMVKNPLLKEEYKRKKKNSNEYENIYFSKNKYDVIIIDEAHEHNPNMDLILTLARQSCYMNNSIKIVIMSATMDDDEPIFRRYYHIINDNLVYPLREKINYFNNEIFYDSIYLDRRLHIAQPGISTQYKIDEYYVNNKTVEEIVNKILNSSTTGDILIFENGTSDIYKRIKSLNNIIPPYIIALPYISSINQKYKNIIENIDTKIANIRTDKNKVSDVWTENYIESNDVNEGTYKRAIIIATNVAEASLTITSLKYIIDNGYSKVNKYNDLFDKEDLVVEMISESNRKQRKGRVGRVSNGTVYYLYDKGSRENIKQQYKINQINFGESLLQLLEKKSLSQIIYELENPRDLINELQKLNNDFTVLQIDADEDNIIREGLLSEIFDPNFIKIINDEINISFFDNINPKTIYDISESLFYRKKILKIFLNQFFTKNYKQYWDINYYGNIDENLYRSFYRNDSGYNISTLIDIPCVFYIIHPFEHIIKRNILGNIIEYYIDNKWETIDKKNLPISIFTNLLNNLAYKYFLVNIKADNFNYLNYANMDVDVLYKTELFELVYKLKQYIDLHELTSNDLIVLLTSQAYGSFNEVLEVLIMIKTINSSMKNLIINKKLYDNEDIEIEYLHTLIQSFKKNFDFIDIFKFIDSKSIKIKYDNQIQNIINEYIKDKDKPVTRKYTVSQWNKLNYLYLNGSLKKNGFSYLINDKLKEIYNFENNKKDIVRWCDINNVNSDIFIEYLNNFIKAKIELLTTDKYIDYKTPEPTAFDLINIDSYNFKKSLLNNNKYEKIIRPFLHGSPFNIGIKFNIYDIYYHSIPDTLVHNMYKPNKCNLLYYYKNDTNNDKIYDFNISITNKIEIEWLFNILPIYYKPANFKNTIIHYNGTEFKIKQYNGNLFNEFCYNLKNKWSLNNIPYISSNMEILSVFFENYKKNSILTEN
jgi:hypothetical protein